MKLSLVLFIVMSWLPLAHGVPKDSAPRVEDDPSLEVAQPLDLDAETNGYRSVEDMGADSAEIRYYNENVEDVDATLIQEIESNSLAEVNDSQEEFDEEIGKELSQLQ